MRMIPAMVLLVAATACGQVIHDMDTVKFSAPKPGKDGKSRGEAKLVPGKQGKAVQFTFENNCRNAFFSGRVTNPAEWDKAEGISFWVKGDGSDHVGSIELIDSTYRERYGIAFPLNHTGWKKFTYPWRDVIPEMATADFMGVKDGFKPSGLRSFWFGKWHYWRDVRAHSYAIDQIQLEAKVELKPTPAPPEGDPLARTLKKLKAGKPVTIVTMGDSLTDYKHWANRNVNWPTLLKQSLEAKYRSKVTIVNPAIGGRETKHLLIMMPTWTTKTPNPDLVTVCFGGNDYSSGMRGPHFKETVAFAIDRIRRETGADVLMMTTSPGLRRWDTMEELAVACRESTKAKNAGLADIAKAFHEQGDSNEALRTTFYVHDKTHLAKAGHEIVAKTVAAAIASGGKWQSGHDAPKSKCKSACCSGG